MQLSKIIHVLPGGCVRIQKNAFDLSSIFQQVLKKGFFSRFCCKRKGRDRDVQDNGDEHDVVRERFHVRWCQLLFVEIFCLVECLVKILSLNGETKSESGAFIWVLFFIKIGV